MPSNARLVRRRIKSITNTRKITKAMELVAGAKMRKAVAAVLATRPYADAVWRTVGELAGRADPKQHPLLRRDGSGRELVVVFAADRGLCGGINSRLLKSIGEYVKGDYATKDFAVIGRRGMQMLRRRGAPIVASWPGISKEPRVADIMALAQLAIDDFAGGKYDAISIAYTDFRSSLVQEPRLKKLLPLGGRSSELGAAEDLDGRPLAKTETTAEKTTGENGDDFTFEPSADAVLTAVLPRLVEVQMFQALLETLASEHSARMMAMRAASDSAGDMIQSLTFALNQARQAAITMEIAEISSGKAALEQNS